MSVIRKDEAIRKSPTDGANARIVHGEKLTAATWSLAAGTTLPLHSHPHEQITVVVDGTLDLSIGGTVHRLESGDSAVIPGDVEHEATAVVDTVVVDAFAPVREDLK